MKDPYSVLGVTRTSNLAEIKKAFRKLAKQYHPDQNKDAKAAAKFAEVNSAYEILGDEAKRGQYDRGEIDGEGKPRHPGFEGFSAGGGRAYSGGGAQRGFNFDDTPRGFEDILSEMFGGGMRNKSSQQQAVRGQDIHATGQIPFTVWALGGKTRIDLGRGRIVDATIPAGIAPGKIIRLRGQGEAGSFGAPSGDALVTISVEPHEHLRAEGNNLRVDVNITIYEAALGGKIRIPTLQGPVDMNLPAGTTGLRSFRLKGKGVQARTEPGDLIVQPRIIMPEKIDPDLEAALTRLSEEGYDPGRK